MARNEINKIIVDVIEEESKELDDGEGNLIQSILEFEMSNLDGFKNTSVIIREYDKIFTKAINKR